MAPSSIATPPPIIAHTVHHQHGSLNGAQRSVANQHLCPKLIIIPDLSTWKQISPATQCCVGECAPETQYWIAPGQVVFMLEPWPESSPRPGKFLPAAAR